MYSSTAAREGGSEVLGSIHLVSCHKRQGEHGRGVPGGESMYSLRNRRASLNLPFGRFSMDDRLSFYFSLSFKSSFSFPLHHLPLPFTMLTSESAPGRAEK